jgi:hypothetical protein
MPLETQSLTCTACITTKSPVMAYTRALMSSSSSLMVVLQASAVDRCPPFHCGDHATVSSESVTLSSYLEVGATRVSACGCAGVSEERERGGGQPHLSQPTHSAVQVELSLSSQQVKRMRWVP